MRKLSRLALLVAFCSIAVSGLAESPATPVSGPAEEPLSKLPYRPGLDLSAMDQAADACTDFYQYSCGGWIKANPIPADQSQWSVYGALNADNQRYLWGILDSLAKTGADRSPAQQQIGDYFAACMDEASVERLGVTPVREPLGLVTRMTSKRDLGAVLGALQPTIGGSGLFFGFGSDQDFADSSQVIAFASAGGLGLPDRDYYTKQDARSKDIRRKYLAHVARMFTLLGDDLKAAGREAATVMRIETALAEASLTRVEQRDPHNLFHKVDAEGLQALTPGFNWGVYLQHANLAGLHTFNVTEPAFYRAFAKQLRVNSLAELQTYLRWHVADASAPYLSKAFVDENFDFYSKTLRGVPKQRPRWKRCVTLVDRQLGEALGQEFVRRTFGPELKQQTLLMTQKIEQAMADDLNGLTWMSPETKREALSKLHALTNKIGYPDKWRDYGSVHIQRDDFAGNVAHATLFESRRELAKIGKPVDRDEWGMTPPTVNAYYNAQMNDINFPAGVLQPPLYDPRMDSAPNYGNTGGTIGHELTHGFDDEGRQFDGHGNLRDWWTESDSKEFTNRAQCVVDQYAQYTVVDDIKINSKLTEGEDVADLGGLVLAWMAWKAETLNSTPDARDGFAPEQRFFIGYAQWACEATRPEQLRVSALTDPHSPGKFRVNGVVANMPEFAAAFSCKVGQPMAPQQHCRVW